MARILIVDDDESIRRLIRLNLVDLYEICDTGKPEEALALALEHKPDAILLDLRMPGYSGFELCKMFTSFSATQLIPIFVISGEGGAKTKDFCRDLGAAAYFEKPVNFEALRSTLADTLQGRRVERRRELRVGLRVPLKLCGQDANGTPFQLPTTALNVSKGGFLCACSALLPIGTIVEVWLLRAEQEHVGKAQVVRAECPGTEYPRYGFAFMGPTEAWVLQ
jgi:DNA-binding response OmpR family regulator